MLSGTQTVTAAIVGIDGCGKTSTFTDALARLSQEMHVAGVGEQILTASPGVPLSARADIPLSRSAQIVGRLAKGLRSWGLYKQMKLLELSERSQMGQYLVAHQKPAALLTDGDPLTNITAWSVARFYSRWLTSDEELLDVIRYMAGERRIPSAQLPRYARRAWQLVLINRLHLVRLRTPGIVVLLQIPPATAMARIASRGRPLQKHENEPFLAELAAAYDRVCRVLEERCGVQVVRIDVTRTSHDDAVAQVAGIIRRSVEVPGAPEHAPGAPGIDIIATTMSGSLKDQRKVGRIGPEFESRTGLPVRVHLADTHVEARDVTRRIVDGGARTLVSAGGAGTFNAVLEGCHVDGRIPEDLRLAFLRKGSADLIGKALHIADSLPRAVTQIVGGLDAGTLVRADVLEVEAIEPDGTRDVRHMIGFGGLGIFGEVPRFTEARGIKLYKGILGTLFGDLGPFYTGLALAVVSWRIQRLIGRVPPVQLTLDGETLQPDVWAALAVLNGDLGDDVPLGRGLSFSSGTFRVVALRYRGARKALEQIDACRTGRVLENPERYSALVREVRSLSASPARRCPRYMVNVDGLRMQSTGTVRVHVSGSVQLVEGAALGEVAEASDTAQPAAVGGTAANA